MVAREEALVAGLLDAGKGSLCVLLARLLGFGPAGEVLAAIFAIVGHSRSPFIAMHGGRGVAPATGGALIIEPLILAVMFPVFIITILLTRISSLGSLAASAIGGLIMIVVTVATSLPPIYFVYGVGAPGLIWLFHLDNIQRLLAGKERRIGPRSAGTGDDDGPANRATENRP